MEYTLVIIITLFGTRTLFWHLQNWQLREYRFDRMNAYLRTNEGIKSLFNFWFFPGVLPRPKFSGRIFMIIGIFSLLQIAWSLSLYFYLTNNFTAACDSIKTCVIFPEFFFTWFILILERIIWLSVTIGIIISKIPVWICQQLLFSNARSIRESAQNLTVIGIAGSYGKSSTKEILRHLLQNEFGKENILFNPENQNNEVAIARLMINNLHFFKSEKQKFFVCEVGAYRQGEITKVCQFIQPQISILTGLNAQHIELFGSQKNIQKAKFEMAENTSKKVFFNRDNALLSEIFEDRKINATKVAISPSIAKNIKPSSHKTTFELYGENFSLPWPGEFFVANAILALECARECGIKREKLPNLLKTIPQLDRALKIESFENGHILWDLYSANPDGVLSAIAHLGQFKAKKIFIGMPLRELGNQAPKIHEKFFRALKQINAEVFWCKDDFTDMGKTICEKNFHLVSKTKLGSLKKALKNIDKDDAILCESKLPKFVLDLIKK